MPSCCGPQNPNTLRATQLLAHSVLTASLCVPRTPLPIAWPPLRRSAVTNERLEKIKNNSEINIVELSPEQQDAFRKMAMPVRKTFVDEVGGSAQASLDALTKAVEESSSSSEGHKSDSQ